VEEKSMVNNLLDELPITPAQLRKACDKVGGVYAMARLIGKGHTPQYLYRRLKGKVKISEMDALAIRKALELAMDRT
jgi:DNA-binding transcriptional regulator YdaS (Cro superfamily)